MDPEVLAEAKDFVSSWIDKAGADGNGINMDVSSSGSCNYSVDGLQGYQGRDGPPVRSLLALHHGRGLLLRGDPPGQVHPPHVLRWQDRGAALQVLKEKPLLRVEQ